MKREREREEKRVGKRVEAEIDEERGGSGTWNGGEVRFYDVK